MALIPILTQTQETNIKDSPKFGRVIANNDPDQLGKIKVLIPGIFEGDTANLPWIRRKQDTIFCGNDCEIFDVPELGSIVEVKWNYDENTPMYSGAPLSKKHSSGLFTNNYPYEGGIKFGKMYIKFDKGSNNLIISNGKTFIQCDSLGNINFVANGNVCITAERDCNITAPNVNVDGNLNVNGNFNCTRGANGSITPTSLASVAGGLVTGIQ